MSAHSRIRLQSPLLPVLTGLLLVLQILWPYEGWLVLLAGLGGAWLAAYLWVRSLRGGLAVRRERRFGWAQVGDRLEERFTLINRSTLPAVWVELIDGSTLPDYQVSRVTGVGGLAQNQWRTQGVCTRRGVFTLGPTGLRTADPLGIYTLEIFDAKAITVIVTPPVVPLPAIEVARGGRSGEGRPLPNAPERAVSSSGVRAYAPGDPLHHIHWRTSARMSELYVHQFEGAPAGDWWIVLDLSAAVQAGQGQDSTEEHGVILAASLADRGLRARQSVGIVTNSRKPVLSTPAADAGQRLEILRALAVVSPGEYSLSELLARMKPALARRHSLILITPDVSGEWIQPLLPLLWAGATPTVLLLDPASFGGAGDPQATLRLLTGLGIRHYLITPELLNRSEARPGQAGRWEWRVSPRGRAIAIHRPEEGGWKVVA